MTTQEAFASLIAKRAVHNDLGISSDIVRNWRRSLKEGKLTEDFMAQQLRRSGYTIAIERQWEGPK